MQDLLDINKNAIFAKLDNAPKTNDGLWICNGIINALSESTVRDKRLIDAYTEDEITIRKTRANGPLREHRCFTQKGIERYIHEGKIYSYKNACAYFKITPKDKEREKKKETLHKCITTNGEEENDDGDTDDNNGGDNKDEDNKNHKPQTTLDTKKTLKWIFEKRKNAKELGEKTTLEDIITWLTDYSKDDLDDDNKKEKLELLNELNELNE